MGRTKKKLHYVGVTDDVDKSVEKTCGGSAPRNEHSRRFRPSSSFSVKFLNQFDSIAIFQDCSSTYV